MGEAVVLVVNIVGIIDRGCATVASSDMALLGGKGELGVRVVVSFSVWVVASIVLVIVSLLKLMLSTICVV